MALSKSLTVSHCMSIEGTSFPIYINGSIQSNASDVVPIFKIFETQSFNASFIVSVYVQSQTGRR